MFLCGYFEITEQSSDDPNWQVPYTDWVQEIETGLTKEPSKIILVNENDWFGIGVDIFVGTGVSNGHANVMTERVGSASENVPFTDPEAKYLRYENGYIYISVSQWTHIKNGKWMWIAIYE